MITTLADGTKHMLWNGDVLDMTGANVAASFKADATVTVAGTQITNATVGCVSTTPSPLPAAFDYTVSGADLILSLANGTTAATTYTRRGCAPGNVTATHVTNPRPRKARARPRALAHQVQERRRASRADRSPAPRRAPASARTSSRRRGW